jgi:hypothetical protein
MRRRSAVLEAVPTPPTTHSLTRKPTFLGLVFTSPRLLFSYHDTTRFEQQQLHQLLLRRQVFERSCPCCLLLLEVSGSSAPCAVCSLCRLIGGATSDFGQHANPAIAALSLLFSKYVSSVLGVRFLIPFPLDHAFLRTPIHTHHERTVPVIRSSVQALLSRNFLDFPSSLLRYG